MHPNPHYRIALQGVILALFAGWILSIPLLVFSQEKPAFQQYRYQNDFRFRRIGVAEGLSSPEVTAILQDRQGFIWVGTADGLNRYDGYDFLIFRNDPADSASLSNNQVTALTEDGQGFLWVGTVRGLNRFDPSTGAFSRFFADTLYPGRLRDDHIRCLHPGRSGLLWIGTNRGGLNALDLKTGTFQTISLGNDCVQAIEEDQDGNLWLGTMGGLCFFDKKKGSFRTWSEEVDNPRALSQNWVNAVIQDPEGYIWAGATHGLNRLDPATGLFRQFWQEPKPFSLRANGHRILSFFIDRSGNMWIGTQWGGLYRYDYCNNLFYRVIYDISDPHSLSDNVVNCIFQDREGALWVGTGAGLNLLDPEPNPFRTITYNAADTASLRDLNVLSFLEESPDTLWVGTERGGLLASSPPYEKFVAFPRGFRGWYPMIHALAPDASGDHWIGTMGSGFARLGHAVGKFRYWRFDPSNRNWIATLLKDGQGDVWYGSLGGINLFCPETDTAFYYPFAPEDPLSRMTSAVTTMLDDSRGRLWVGTSKHGLKLFDRKTDRYEHLPTGSTGIAAVLEDRKNRIWVATLDAGFFQYDPEGGIRRSFSVKNGLSGDAISGMAEDAEGYLWISTGSGLSRFDPERETFRNYDAGDGLPSSSLTGIYRGPFTGQIFVATLGKGFGVFYPDSLSENAFVPPVVISSLQRIRREGGEMVVLEEKGISGKDRIRLSYRDDIVTFRVAALSFRKIAKNQYAYLLEGFNDHWIPLGTRREITFTGLAPGSYTLRVKASNGDGVWNEEGVALKIRVVPPWYGSFGAWLVYLAIGVLGVRAVHRFQLSRRLAAAETLRLKELEAFKSRFFTNITHEFRTPLTIIGGMARQIRENPNRWMGEGLDMIERNSAQLLSLVIQMLDLAKLESGVLPLKMQQGDILVYLKYLLESFHSYAEASGLELSFEAPPGEMVMDYDPEKIQQIVSNLLSNAIRFTPEGGRVWMDARMEGGTPPLLVVRVGDNGPGIEKDKLPYVFDRFFQAGQTSDGAGIGLSLTRELVRLLGGRIEVRSRAGEGTVFSVWLPVKKEALPGAAPLPVRKESLAPPSGPDLPLALIVEDNPDVVSYLSAFLEGQYRLEAAVNGREGIEKGLALVPDLIISDVMMPEKDGFEVCRFLKMDVRTSHIPIVLLTARADMDSRLQGLEHGADVYLPKPFHKEELLLHLRKLHELRKTLRAYYLSLAAGAPAQAPESTPKEEDEFVLRVRGLIEAHLSDPHYSVEQLCRELAMGYSNLHRKLTALTGYSANHFIRYIRLCEAKRLLRETPITISEAAFQSGFEDPAYFARAFKKEFGLTPTEWRG
ncbi:MAG: two-component regulator propeller domain-containing protein [Saprospiraceae bacterium]